jgi:hypothetical protein
MNPHYTPVSLWPGKSPLVSESDVLCELRQPKGMQRVVITAGGTEVPLDDVRRLTNSSSGDFGLLLAREFANAGIQVTFVCTPRASEKMTRYDSFDVKEFVTFDDLSRVLEETLKTLTPDFVFHAAAVSDYSAGKAAGKISSDLEVLTLELRRNPKLIAKLREQSGRESFVTGFKLTSGSTPSEQFAAAYKQVHDNRLNLTFANDRQHMKPHRTRGLAVTPEGGAILLDGTRNEVAAKLVHLARQRADVRWFKTIVDTGEAARGNQTLGWSPDSALRHAQELLIFAQESGLLCNSSGNVSSRASSDSGEIGFIVSPRQVDKGSLPGDQLVAVNVNLKERTVTCASPDSKRKSSIDSGVQAVLYHELPAVRHLLHFHPTAALVLPDVTTRIPYPCGTVEEAGEILQALDSTNPLLRERGDFLLSLNHHGYLLFLTDAGKEKLRHSWKQCVELYREHLIDIGEPALFERLTLHPLIAKAQVVGILSFNPVDELSSIYLAPAYRTTGMGRSFADQLLARGDTIGAHRLCDVKDYYVTLGCKAEDVTGLFRITSPQHRVDMIPCASAYLVDPVRKKILLLNSPPEGVPQEVMTPTARLLKDESASDAALRALASESGIVLMNDRALKTIPYFAAEGAMGEQGYRVMAHVYFGDSEVYKASSPSSNAFWTDLHQCSRLPLSPAARRIVMQIRREMRSFEGERPA